MQYGKNCDGAVCRENINTGWLVRTGSATEVTLQLALEGRLGTWHMEKGKGGFRAEKTTPGTSSKRGDSVRWEKHVPGVLFHPSVNLENISLKPENLFINHAWVLLFICILKMREVYFLN